MTDVIRVPGVTKLSGAELRELERAAAVAGVPLDCLAVLISLESGFIARARNPNGSATGLLQWTDVGARAVDTTPSEISTMSRRDQLELAGKYLARVLRSLRQTPASCEELYLANFCPAVVGSRDETILGISDPAPLPPTPGLIPKPSEDGPCGNMGKVYAANLGLDTDGNGLLTVGDVRAHAREFTRQHADKPRVTIPAAAKSSGGGKLAWALAAFVAWKALS